MTLVEMDRRARITPSELAEQAEEARELMRAVLKENVDYGNIPGIAKPTLLKPGAEWLLRWANLGHRMEEVRVERDGEGRPYGITYRCLVYRLDLPDQIMATCDGYAGYDEPDREEHENKWGKRVPRAPWNTMIMMAQKRALVGAARAATATSGLFTQDMEDAPVARPEPATDLERANLREAIASLSDEQVATLKLCWWAASMPGLEKETFTSAHAAKVRAIIDRIKPPPCEADAAETVEDAEVVEEQGTPDPVACEHEWDEDPDGLAFCVKCGERG